VSEWWSPKRRKEGGLTGLRASDVDFEAIILRGIAGVVLLESQSDHLLNIFAHGHSNSAIRNIKIERTSVDTEGTDFLLIS